MNFRIRHRTEYDYDGSVDLCHNEARLQPRDTARQRCVRSLLVVEPWPQVYHERVDFFGNRVAYFAVQEPHTKLVVTATSEVHVGQGDSVDLARSGAWEKARLLLGDLDLAKGAAVRQFVLDSPLVQIAPEAKTYAEPSFAPCRPLLEAVADLMSRIYRDFTYLPGFTEVTTPLAEVFTHRKGVCQDFAHIGIACLRSLGLPARYVSGYLETLPPPGKEKLVGSDATHAWFAVFDPEQGWVDFDPTNDQLPGQQHITTAWGRDFRDVTPLKGILYGSGEHRLAVSVDVERMAE